MHFETKNSDPFQKQQAVSESYDLKRIFGITRLFLWLPKVLARLAVSPSSATHAPDSSKLF